MAVIGGVTSNRTGTLIKLLDDARSEFGHSARHLQDHLASLLGSDARPVILAPGPHVFYKRAIGSSRYRIFAAMRSEVWHSVVPRVSLPGDPAEAVSIENRIPAFLF